MEMMKEGREGKEIGRERGRERKVDREGKEGRNIYESVYPQTRTLTST